MTQSKLDKIKSSWMLMNSFSGVDRFLKTRALSRANKYISLCALNSWRTHFTHFIWKKYVWRFQHCRFYLHSIYSFPIYRYIFAIKRNMVFLGNNFQKLHLKLTSHRAKRNACYHSWIFFIMSFFTGFRHRRILYLLYFSQKYTRQFISWKLKYVLILLKNGSWKVFTIVFIEEYFIYHIFRKK